MSTKTLLVNNTNRSANNLQKGKSLKVYKARNLIELHICAYTVLHLKSYVQLCIVYVNNVAEMLASFL